MGCVELNGGRDYSKQTLLDPATRGIAKASSKLEALSLAREGGSGTASGGTQSSSTTETSSTASGGAGKGAHGYQQSALSSIPTSRIREQQQLIREGSCGTSGAAPEDDPGRVLESRKAGDDAREHIRRLVAPARPISQQVEANALNGRIGRVTQPLLSGIALIASVHRQQFAISFFC